MEYIVETLLPAGEIHILAGASAAGKTTLLFQFIQAWRRGKPILGFKSEPAPICYIGGDRRGNAYERLEQRLGVDPIPFISVIDACRESEVCPKIDLAWLSKMLTYFNPEPEVLFLDPLDLFIGVTNFNDKHQVATGMVRLAQWLGERTAICMLHPAKVRENAQFLDIFDMISGSHSLQAYCSTRAFLVRHDKHHDGQSCLYIRGQDFPEHQVALSIDENGAFAVQSIHSDWNTIETLLRRFPPGSVETATLVNLMTEDGAASRSSTFRALSALAKSGKITKLEHGLWTRLNIAKR